MHMEGKTARNPRRASRGDIRDSQTQGYGGGHGSEIGSRIGSRVRGFEWKGSNPLWEPARPNIFADQKKRFAELQAQIAAQRQRIRPARNTVQWVTSRGVSYGVRPQLMGTPSGPVLAYTTEVDNYTDEMFGGLEGATFRFRGNTYAIRNGDIYVMEGMEIDSLDGLGEMSGFFKKLGKVLRAPLKLTKKLHNIGTKKTRKFVKSKAGKIVIGVALAATGVGLIGMAAYGAAGIGAGISAVGSAAGAGIASGATAAWGGITTAAKFVGGKAVSLFAKKGGAGDTGVSVLEPSAQAAQGAISRPVWGGGSASGWFSAENLKSAASLATTAVGAYATYQGAVAAGQAAQAGAAIDPNAAAAGYAPGYGPGGGYGGGYQGGGGGGGGETFPAGGLDTSFEPGGQPDIPDVTRFASMSPALLILGGGLLLTAILSSQKGR